MIHGWTPAPATTPREESRSAAAPSRTSTLITACPCCDSTRLDHLYTIENVPVHSCILFTTRPAAETYTRGDVELAFCHDCAFVFNARYDPTLQEYSENFEESQHFSETFTRFARSLAEAIARDHDLAGRTVLEIGCGKGEFLALLCRIAGCRGVGIDPGAPSSRPERLDADVRPMLRFLRDFYGPQHAGIHADLILCRHTLEHIGPVSDYLGNIRRSLHARADVPVIFETPDALRILREGAFWDIYYEHCSYFTPGAHARAFRRAGFNISRLDLQYDRQYIVQAAVPAQLHGAPSGVRPFAAPVLPLERDLDEARALAADFPRRIAEAQQCWREGLQRARRRARRIAIWGGGSKAVAFLTTLDLADAVDFVIDINPHKQGRFLPGAGLPVQSPDHLLREPPDIVIAMNPIYRAEIQADLAARNISCTLLTL